MAKGFVWKVRHHATPRLTSGLVIPPIFDDSHHNLSRMDTLTRTFPKSSSQRQSKSNTKHIPRSRNMQSSPRKNNNKCLRFIFGWWAVLSILLLLLGRSSGFQYKQDTSEDCNARTMEECQVSPIVWFQCPVSCSEMLHIEGSMAEIHDDPEALYQMSVTKSNGQELSLEDLEGYVTILPSSQPNSLAWPNSTIAC